MGLVDYVRTVPEILSVKRRKRRRKRRRRRRRRRKGEWITKLCRVTVTRHTYVYYSSLPPTISELLYA